MSRIFSTCESLDAASRVLEAQEGEQDDQMHLGTKVGKLVGPPRSDVISNHHADPCDRRLRSARSGLGLNRNGLLQKSGHLPDELEIWLSKATSPRHVEESLRELALFDQKAESLAETFPDRVRPLAAAVTRAANSADEP